MRAFEVYQQIQRHGWPLVAALRPLHLTEAEAEGLFLRLEILHDTFPAMLAAWRGEGTPDTARPGPDPGPPAPLEGADHDHARDR